MLDLKRYCVHLRKFNAPRGNYTQWFFDGTSWMHAKHRAKLQFGPGWEVIDVFGPFEPGDRHGNVTF